MLRFAFQEFRPVFEMHGIVVIPLAAPYEAMPFKYFDNLGRDLVPVGVTSFGIRFGPSPVIGIFSGDIDSCCTSMRAQSFCAFDESAIHGSCWRNEIFIVSGGQLIQFMRYFC